MGLVYFCLIVDDPVACATCKAFVTRIDEAIANNEEDVSGTNLILSF